MVDLPIPLRRCFSLCSSQPASALQQGADRRPGNDRRSALEADPHSPRGNRRRAAVARRRRADQLLLTPARRKTPLPSTTSRPGSTAQGIPVNTTSAVNILVARYGTPLAHSIYTDSLPQADRQPAAEMPEEMKPEGYAIIPDGKGLALTAATDSGIFYALQTVKQLVTGYGANAVLHTAKIRDWPAMKYRGLDDDLSRGPVTTLEFEKKLIRTIAAYKINLYSPYFEHTAAYASNPLIAPPGGGISAADAAALVAYARALPRHHRARAGGLRPSAQRPPLGAVPAARRNAARRRPRARPARLHRPHQAGVRRARRRVSRPVPAHRRRRDRRPRPRPDQSRRRRARPRARSTWTSCSRSSTALQPLHRRLLFWGDIAQDSPDLLKALPQSFKDATIAVAWGYNPEPKGFAKSLTPFTNAGFETWVSPSVHNFRVVYPDNNMALPNIQQFTRDGQKLGSTGQLNTIWNDDGEGLFNQDWYGILFGAAAAWQPGESSIEAFEQSYAQVFHGDATGASTRRSLS